MSTNIQHLANLASQRFQAGSEAYSEAAGQAANTQNFQRAADTALANLQGVKYSAASAGESVAAPGRPMLSPPVPGLTGSKQGAEDTLTLLMASLISLLGDVSIDSLKSRLETLKAAAKASKESSEALSAKYLSAVAEMDAAVTSASAHEEKLASAKTSLDAANAELTSAEADLAKAKPETPEHKKALAARDAAQSKVASAEQQFSKDQAAQLAAIKTAGEAGKKTEELGTQVQNASLGGKPVLDGMKTQLNAAATMVLLMANFAELMGKSAEDKIDMEQELFKSMQAARQEYMEKKSDEYLEEVRKAEEANKTMGCIGKILGAVLMVISVAAAAFTGGASLVLAGVGVALMGADMLVKELTGVSFMEQAMKPLMDAIGPLMEQLGKAISGVLKDMGVDAKTADMAGMIMGAIVVGIAMAVVMAVVMVVGKSAAGQMASAMGKVFGKMASKMLPQVLKQAAKSVSKSFTNIMTKARTSLGLKSDTNSLKMYATRMAIAETTIQAGGTVAQTSMAIKSGVHQRNAAEFKADFELAMSISETLKVYLSDMVQYFDQTMKAKDEAIKKAFNLQDSINTNSLNMARNI
ncbi:type III secretion system translocon subunit SctE [Pseudomonas chlororaphis subsp. aurantiaca]|uniref:type III secretion system translocon subunit SctE n=1 Tax=Pseudomonas chlororaphis TaxID=587753 RepID=UPI0027DBD2FA|nr:type III secretion system translocon subunit SctE [Pseudomonas chlororaphis]WMI97552.1 type III secretion system translocon subunit SctE [Pseudomonas chlororaphis subsp. aurantiaca]